MAPKENPPPVGSRAAGYSRSLKRNCNPTNAAWQAYRLQVKVRAQGRWRYILAELGLAVESLKNKHGPCPGCGGTDRFRFDDKDGRGTFVCSQGGGETLSDDGFGLLMHAQLWTFTQAVDAVGGVFGIRRPGASNTVASSRTPKAAPPLMRRVESSPERLEHLERKRREALRRDYRNSKPVNKLDQNAAPLYAYLARRGLSAILADLPNDLRYTSTLDYYENGKKTGSYPAMLAVVSTPAGQPVTLHRTYLSEDGHKAPVEAPRKLRALPRQGEAKGGAIRLYPATERVAVAEGIETALAVRIATGKPVWAAISANGMATLEFPKTIREVDIYADNDANEAGQSAANKLAQRLKREGIKTAIYLPERAGDDWADVLAREIQL